MSRHEGVSCDSCLKSNFRGRRYKCLICYDYDLCAACYETGATTSQHITDHPMQCILTRSDFDLYYSGEALGLEQPQAYTCPFCNRMGFTDAALQEHVTAEHSETQLEVVCPVCASMPGGEPNLVTDDFAGHLTLEHRSGPRDLISFLDEPSAIRHGGVRRIPHGSASRGVTRTRRTNMHFSSSGGLNSLSPSSRDAVVDPIAELLSQLSGVRRSQAAAVAAAAAGNAAGNASSGASSAQPPAPTQLQQLQMQLQLERQQVSAARQQLERLPNRRQAAALAGAGAGASGAARDAHHAHRAAREAAPSAPTDRRLLAEWPSAAGTPSDEGREAAAAAAARAERGALLRGLLLASLAPPPPPAPAPPPASAPPPPRRAAPPAPAAPPPAAPATRGDPRPLKAPPQQKLRAKGDQARTGPHLPDAR